VSGIKRWKGVWVGLGWVDRLIIIAKWGVMILFLLSFVALMCDYDRGTKASIEREMGLFYLVFCFLYSRLGWDSDGMGHWGYEAFPTSCSLANLLCLLC
jgi:hypothetical protein